MDGFIKAVAAFFIAVGVFLFGGMDGLFVALIGLIVLDYITGVLVAVIQKKLSSAIGAKGIAKKILMFAIVALANIVDVYVIGNGANPLRTMAILFYMANEGISIIENSGRLGVPVPKKLMDVLSQLKDKGDNGDDKD